MYITKKRCNNLRVASYELNFFFTSWKWKLQAANLFYELRVTIHELQVTFYELKIKFTSC